MTDLTKGSNDIYARDKNISGYEENLADLKNEFNRKLVDSASTQGDWFSDSFKGAYVASGIVFAIVTAVLALFVKDFSFEFSLPLGIATALILLIIVALHNNLKLHQKNAEVGVAYLKMRNLQNFIASLRQTSPKMHADSEEKGSR